MQAKADLRRRSYRVEFASLRGERLAGIVDEASNETLPNQSVLDELLSDGLQSVLNQNPVAVFSHCFTCNKDLKAIVRVSRNLADLGITVLRFDMTGLGNSSGDFCQTNFSTNCDDLRCAIEFATTSLGPVRSLIGHSFGGAAALAVAANKDFQPLSTVGALVLLAAPSDTKHLAELLRAMNPGIESDGFGEVSIGGRQWTIGQEMLLDFQRHDLTAMIPQIQLPTLLFHSPTDQTVGFDHALRIMGLMNGDVSLVAMKDSDHLLTRHSADWDWVARTAAAFIERQVLVACSSKASSLSQKPRV